MRHMERHHIKSRSFVCYYCGKSFNVSVELDKHIRTHTGERPFACDLCPKMFSRSDKLKQHKDVHFGIKPHVCEVYFKDNFSNCINVDQINSNKIKLYSSPADLQQEIQPSLQSHITYSITRKFICFQCVYQKKFNYFSQCWYDILVRNDLLLSLLMRLTSRSYK